MKYDFSSPSKFEEQVKEQLAQKAMEAIDKIREEMRGVNESEDGSDDEEVESELVILINDEDNVQVEKIAGSLGIETSYNDDAGTVELEDYDEDALEKFFDELERNDIEYEVVDDNFFSSDDDEDMDEATKLRVHTKASDKLAHKRYYRKNKSKLKLKARRFRKTSKFKRYVKLAKRKARVGRTARGKRQVKRI